MRTFQTSRLRISADLSSSPLRSNMHEPKRTDRVQSVAQSKKSRALRKEHEESVEALEEVRVLFRFEQL